MGPRTTLAIACAVLAGFTALLLATDRWGAGPERDGIPEYPYLLEDLYDLSSYQQRGRWAASGATPYLEEFSEYPQISTWLMGLPYAFFDHRVRRGEPYATIRAAREHFVGGGLPADDVDRALGRLKRVDLVYDESVLDRPGPHPAAEIWRSVQRRPGLDADVSRAHVLAVWRAWQDYHQEHRRNTKTYGDVHHVLMAVLFALLIALVIANLRLLGAPPWAALLLLLPGSLYFAFNRHDLPVTVLVSWALWLQLRHRFVAAGFVIGLGLMTKWYPLVLAPLFLSHAGWTLWRPREEDLRRGAVPLSFGRAFAKGVLAPGLAVTSVVVVVLGITYVWHGGGWPAVTRVFEWHATVRQPNHASIVGLLTSDAAGWGWLPMRMIDDLSRAFLVLQLVPPFLIALLPLRSRKALIEASILATCGMVIFSKFFSPQWVLWILALAVLRVHERRIYLVLIVLVQFVLYVQLPVTFYSSGVAHGELTVSTPFRIPTDVRVVLLLLLWSASIHGLVRALRTSEGAAQPAPGAAGHAGLSGADAAPATPGGR